MAGNTLFENTARIMHYCRTWRRKFQIMSALDLNDVEAEAYTAILTRQRLLEANLERYRTTHQGLSYLDIKDRVEYR